MPFNSVAFLLGFLPVTVGGCLLAGRLGQTWIKRWLIVTSLLFYELNAPQHLPLLLAILGGNLALGQTLRSRRRAGLIAACGVLLNLAILCWFKYLAPEIWPDAALPSGLSFFVFTQIGLLLWLAAPDAKRVTLLDQTLFSVFFPALLSGPILNPHDTLPEFHRDRTLGLTGERVAVGLGFFCIGLAKKTLLADPLGQAVAEGFGDPAAAGTLGAWLAAVGWYLQLYLDFSAYSDMAVGLAWLVGIHLPDNFDQPYRAASVIQYWQRWHMSLTRFLMANVHAPLTLAVLRRRRRLALPINEDAQRSISGFTIMIGAPIVATMLLAGMWHGANVTFLVFGLLHAACLLINHAWRLSRRPSLSPALAICLTQFAVLTGAVIFRAATLDDAWGMLTTMAGLHGLGTFDFHELRVFLRLAGLLALIWFAPTTRQFMLQEVNDVRLCWRPTPSMALAMGGLATLGLLACSGTQTFVYFSF